MQKLALAHTRLDNLTCAGRTKQNGVALYTHAAHAAHTHTFMHDYACSVVLVQFSAVEIALEAFACHITIANRDRIFDSIFSGTD